MSAALMSHDPAASSDSASEVRVIRTAAFGEIDVPAKALMTFADALLGFPDRHEYALLPAAREGLYWLQSTTDDVTTFLLADPFAVEAAYAFDLSEHDKAALDIGAPDEVLGLVMVTLPVGEQEGVTANFRAPLVFNVRSQRAMQLLTDDDKLALRKTIDLAMFPARAEGMRLR